MQKSESVIAEERQIGHGFNRHDQKSAPAREQAQIKDTLVMIDFKNGDVRHFLKHLAAAVAR